MPEGSPGAGWDLRRLFSPGAQAHEGREDPRTEPHVPAHTAPENPTPITLEDMSDQGGVGSVSKAEATLTHPSARDSIDLPGRYHYVRNRQWYCPQGHTPTWGQRAQGALFSLARYKGTW